MSKAERDPKHLSDLTVEDILNTPTGMARASGKNYILIETIADRPGAVMVGRGERELKQLEELAHEMGHKNIKFFPAVPNDPEQKFPRLENTDPILDEIFED